ncbi:hypothetical protein Echvi_3244 [Echinicola vietnamensis DSM 17526]|uniref:Uncharacterized protein n=1 Tax=Echinicola vietnamensis (strain DSM 17526 / LMG 23754 / KMM 6221) TaxID=926556 RepID=L0G3Q7_ECHVK|nr:hypothetical protein Echvi_3244 [Echinicola vietnamensis DSM 17526]
MVKIESHSDSFNQARILLPSCECLQEDLLEHLENVSRRLDGRTGGRINKLCNPRLGGESAS